MRVAGVHYAVDWRKFDKGTTMFFPCLDPKAAWRELAPEFRRARVKVVRRVVIEEGIRGLRVWRI